MGIFAITCNMIYMAGDLDEVACHAGAMSAALLV